MRTVLAIKNGANSIHNYFTKSKRERQQAEQGRQVRERAIERIHNSLLERLATASSLLGRAKRSPDANLLYRFGIAMFGQDRWSLATEAFDVLEPVEQEVQPGSPVHRAGYLARELRRDRLEKERKARAAESEDMTDRTNRLLGEAVRLLRDLREERRPRGLENMLGIVKSGEQAECIVGR